VATVLSEAGVPLKAIELQLGDSDIGVLLTHYIHLDEK